jgi:hypothetical protein
MPKAAYNPSSGASIDVPPNPLQLTGGGHYFLLWKKKQKTYIYLFIYLTTLSSSDYMASNSRIEIAASFDVRSLAAFVSCIRYVTSGVSFTLAVALWFQCSFSVSNFNAHCNSFEIPGLKFTGFLNYVSETGLCIHFHIRILLSYTQSIMLYPDNRTKHKARYLNETQQEPSARVKTTVLQLHIH